MPNAAALADHSQRTLAILDGLVTQQAAVISYSNDFLLMTFISLVAFPVVLMMRHPKAAAAAPAGGEEEAAAAAE
jgi:DHA2 family multidrug resistance protein